MPNLKKFIRKKEVICRSMAEVEDHAEKLIKANHELSLALNKMIDHASILSGEDAHSWSKDKLMRFVAQVRTLVK